MKSTLSILLVFALIPLANAQTRCECEYADWIDDCDAEFERRGDWIVFESDTEQCSRIDWYTDAQPRLTIVEDGKETVELMSIPESAEIYIVSCKVCKDAQFSGSNINSSGSQAGDVTKRLAGLWAAPSATSFNRLEVSISEAGDEVAVVFRQYYNGKNVLTEEFVGKRRATSLTAILKGRTSFDGVMSGSLSGEVLTVKIDYDGGEMTLDPVQFHRQ